MNKKLVHYYKDKGVTPFRNGVLLFPIDHPDSGNVSNTKEAWTSQVVAWNKDTGVIETQNTIYLPG